MQVNQQKLVPVLNNAVRGLCTKPYHGHPKGCPNYGKKGTCPPHTALWDDICDTKLAMWVFWTKFDLGNHRERMRTTHPQWTRRQLDCCLYWQNTARKPLRDFFKTHRKMPGFYFTLCPEAMGVDITATMHTINIELEWPPEIWTYQVALGGWLK